MNMIRFAPYIEIVIALILGTLLIAFSGKISVLDTPPVVSTSSASSTLSVLPSLTLPLMTFPPLSPKETPATTSMPASVQGASVQETTLSIPQPAIITFVPSKLDTSAIALRRALVNIICYVPSNNNLYSISGSGVIVDQKGIILTNAHIAQYFLLTDYSVSCTIRAGSPATDKYSASLIYISPAWLKANEKVFTQLSPKGTGEYDFALLAITKSATSSVTLPSSFPYVPLATESRDIGTPVAIASYGAQFLKSSQIRSSLFPTVVFGSVKDVFTFATTTIDVLALGGSSAAQEGSSGGGVTDASGKLIGTITTSTIKGDISTRALNAITSSYIRAQYMRETGQPLGVLLIKSTSISVAEFATRIPELKAILTAQLQ